MNLKQLVTTAENTQTITPPLRNKKFTQALTYEELTLLPLLSLWNTLAKENGLTIHAYDSSGYTSKTVKQILYMLVLMTKGEGVRGLPIRPVSATPIPLDLFITYEAIAAAIYRYQKVIKTSYYPIDKTYLPKSFSEFICRKANPRQPSFFEGQSWLLELIINKPRIVGYDLNTMIQKVKDLDSFYLLKSKTIMTATGENNFDKIMADNLIKYIDLVDLNYMLYKDFIPKAEKLFSDPDYFFRMFYKFITEEFLHWENNLSLGHLVWERPTMQAYLSVISDMILEGRSLYCTKEQAWGTAMSRAEFLGKNYKTVALPDATASWYSTFDIELGKNYTMWWEL